MEFLIKRVADMFEGTFGVLMVMREVQGYVPFAVTLEPPWRKNLPNISCIPDGSYQLQRVVSPKYGDVFEVQDVPGRSHVLLHWGNKVDDTEGCILVAEKFGILADQPAVLTSRNSPGEGFNELMAILAGHDAARLSIQWCHQ